MALLAGAAVAVIAIVAVVFFILDRNGDNDVDLAVGTPANGDNGSAATVALDGGFVSGPVRDDYEAPEPGSQAAAVVSQHEHATEAGMRVLEQGGTAADAAIAIAASLSVVEPWFSSVFGGGTWALYFDAETGEVTSLDGVGPTGSNATVEDFGARAESGGIHQSNVPGAWDGWMLWLQEYGELDLEDILTPAIETAREGYTISAEMADWLDRSDIAGRPDTAEIYAPGGVVLGEGDTVQQLDLANTFEDVIVAYNGALDDGRDAAIQAARDYYYRGPIAEALVQFSDENGGYLTLDDFAGFEASIVDPIASQYNDEYTVFQNPPNSQGISQLIALNILRNFDFDGLGPGDPDAIHAQVEAVKLAFADRNNHVGDPDRIDVPVERLLSGDHADIQFDRIDMDNALEPPVKDSFEVTTETSGGEGDEVGGTTTFHIVDADGNAAAVTTSLGAQFLVAGDTGIHMNNRMRFLHLEDGNANQLDPGYKVRHTSNPYMAFRNGQLSILGGNTGVDTQSQAQVQQFINIVEFGMGAQEAVEHPRWVSNGFEASTYPYDAANTIDMESGFSDETVEELRARGHDASIGGQLFGNAEVIILGPDGTSADVGADPRNDTSAGAVIAPGD